MLRAGAPERDFGSILVPLLGGELDEDLVQTAALLVSGEQDDEAAIDTATIEAVWIFRVPMSLPLDAPLPEAQLRGRARGARARQARRRGVRRASRSPPRRSARAASAQAIVEEARRRGVEAIVLAADEARAHAAPGRCSAGARSSARARSSETIRYVVERAPCRVILTAPARPGPQRR